MRHCYIRNINGDSPATVQVVHFSPMSVGCTQFCDVKYYAIKIFTSQKEYILTRRDD